MPKLVWLDTGLVNYAAQVQKEVLGAKDIMDAWRGMIAVIRRTMLHLPFQRKDSTHIKSVPVPADTV